MELFKANLELSIKRTKSGLIDDGRTALVIKRVDRVAIDPAGGVERGRGRQVADRAARVRVVIFWLLPLLRQPIQQPVSTVGRHNTAG